MIIGVCTLELHLPEAFSLKDKRSILKSLLSRLHQQFNVSAAETDDHDLWQSAVIGVAVVSNSTRHAQEVINHIIRWIEVTYPQVQIVRQSTELL